MEQINVGSRVKMASPCGEFEAHLRGVTVAPLNGEAGCIAVQWDSASPGALCGNFPAVVGEVLEHE